jgi:hypothetical protein
LRTFPRQAIVLDFSAIQDFDIAPFEVALLAEASAECCDNINVNIFRITAEITDHRHRRLLRPRHQRPRRRASEPRDELPSPHPQSLVLIGADPIVFRAVWEPVTLGPDAVD